MRALVAIALSAVLPFPVLPAGEIELISVSSAGVLADDLSFDGTVSDDGRYVAFDSDAANLAPGDTNGTADVFLRDRQLGTTVRLSIGWDGTDPDQGATSPSISRDGRYVAFASRSANIVPGDTNTTRDVFVRDRVAGTTTRIGHDPDDSSWVGHLSRDGTLLTFSSWATNLVPADTNDAPDIFAIAPGCR
ncbi:TolB family protein [Catenuloplanes japonicus]|uniref:TolB family protein n=1 Tax=Catenuloplanes japonicus TaxID=33876 RepID=UPI00068D3EA5|nr:hypothetical protein [Catenuloplanes japonicus]